MKKKNPLAELTEEFLDLKRRLNILENWVAVMVPVVFFTVLGSYLFTSGVRSTVERQAERFESMRDTIADQSYQISLLQQHGRVTNQDWITFKWTSVCGTLFGRYYVTRRESGYLFLDGKQWGDKAYTQDEYLKIFYGGLQKPQTYNYGICK